MAHYLEVLGVTDDLLTQAEKVFLDTQGYLVLGEILSDEEVTQIRDHLMILMQREGENAGAYGLALYPTSKRSWS